MTAERGSIRELDPGPDVLSWTIIGLLFLSMVVLPAVVFWIAAQGGPGPVNVPMSVLGVITLTPGVLLGATSLLVMLESG